jgi:hypothetical protein
MALNFHLPTKVFLNIDDFKPKPPDCICAGFPFIYNPVGYAITWYSKKNYRYVA